DVAVDVARLHRRSSEQRRQLRHLALAGAEGAVCVIGLDALPDFVDQPVRLVVRVDQGVRTNVAVECARDGQRPAHQLTPRGHLIGLEAELKCHRDRHRHLLVVVTSCCSVASTPLNLRSTHLTKSGASGIWSADANKSASRCSAATTVSSSGIGSRRSLLWASAEMGTVRPTAAAYFLAHWSGWSRAHCAARS